MKYYRDEILPGVYLTALQTDKFKNGCLSALFLAQLQRETAAAYGLVPFVLRRGTRTLPTMEAVSGRLDELFGSALEPSLRRKGEIQFVGMRADFCDDRYLPGGEKILDDIFALFGELLLRPNTKGGLLLPEYVDSERTQLIQRLESVKNEKRSYAARRLLENMCCYEDYGVGAAGDVANAEAIRYVRLTRDYQSLISTSPMEIFYCGGEPASRIREGLATALETLPRGELNEELGTDIRMNSVEEKVRYFSETMDVTQGCLSMGYRLGECMEDPDYAALRVFNSVFGGCVTSKLFENVREKMSLCYYASSSVDLHKGIMIVNSGIDFANYEVAMDAINAQLEAMRRGEISERELSGAKEALCNAFRASEDSPSALESFYLDQTVLGLDYGPAELAALVEEVTAEQVTEIARSVVPDAVFFLKGESAE